MRIDGTFRSAAPGLGTGSAGRANGPARPARTDRLAFSGQAAAQVSALAQAQARLRAVRQATENAEDSPVVQMVENMKEALEVLELCGKIAARIQDGDEVPQKDLRYLIKNNPAAYLMAMAAREPKEDPRIWESALPQEAQPEDAPAASGVAAEPPRSAEGAGERAAGAKSVEMQA